MIYVFCPDYDEPFGGVAKLYRHVDLLVANGFGAVLLHQQRGFRVRWFDSRTPATSVGEVRIGPGDYLVLPEAVGPEIRGVPSGIRKVIYNQSSYLTFAHYSLDPGDLRTPYRGGDVVAALVVSEDGRRYLEFAFPGLPVYRVRHSIDPELFHPGESKLPRIAFMPRRNPDDALQVINLLKFRGRLEGFELVAIAGRPHREAAAILRSTALFLSFGGPEGFGLPAAEAMACGAVVVGYHGGGGREFFRPEFSTAIERGEIVGFVQAVEGALDLYRTAPDRFAARGAAAAAFIHREYSAAAEARSVVDCWRAIVQSAGDPRSA